MTLSDKKQRADYATERVVRKRWGHKTVGIKNRLERKQWRKTGVNQGERSWDALRTASAGVTGRTCSWVTAQQVQTCWQCCTERKHSPLCWSCEISARKLILGHSRKWMFSFSHKSVAWMIFSFCAFNSKLCWTSAASIECTHHTFSPHLTRWFSVCHREDRWQGPPGSSARYPEPTLPLHHHPGFCPHCPRPAHLLGYRWRSTRWTQWWRLPLGSTPSPNINGSVGESKLVRLTLLLGPILKTNVNNELILLAIIVSVGEAWFSLVLCDI